ncbi:hypothetical protein SR187_0455 [Streptococcus ruminantium]|uniref:Nucleotidyltransferase family protein n=2 Tax=Streptococcus ruminantium TaxID=1917441 RepID=A0A2Z5U220_9STRE|nr:hypothetical protein SR187_0455 [Streptococcus ruminantium]
MLWRRWMIEEFKKSLQAAPDILAILEIIAELNLADCWLCAGTIRNFVWNQYSFDRDTDVDVVFFDEQISYEETLVLESHLRKNYPEYRWEVKNQVYMHIHSPNTPPYKSSKDAIEKFPERCTAIGLRLVEDGQLEVYSPFGVEDMYNYLVRPTPHFKIDPERMLLYRARITKKNWSDKWPTLTIESI